MIVRNAKPNDSAQLHEILVGIIDHGGLTALTHAAIKPSVTDKITEYVETGGFLVVETDRIVGFQYFHPYPGASSHVGDIATFAEIDLRQSGVGRALFAKTVEVARAKGFRKITARIRGDNTNGIPFYAKMGFRTVGVYEAHTLIDGKLVDQVLTEYLL